MRTRIGEVGSPLEYEAPYPNSPRVSGAPGTDIDFHSETGPSLLSRQVLLRPHRTFRTYPSAVPGCKALVSGAPWQSAASGLTQSCCATARATRQARSRATPASQTSGATSQCGSTPRSRDRAGQSKRKRSKGTCRRVPLLGSSISQLYPLVFPSWVPPTSSPTKTARST